MSTLLSSERVALDLLADAVRKAVGTRCFIFIKQEAAKGTTSAEQFLVEFRLALQKFVAQYGEKYGIVLCDEGDCIAPAAVETEDGYHYCEACGPAVEARIAATADAA